MEITLCGQALVVGGSRGIGAAICVELLRSGCGVAFTHTGSPAGCEGAASVSRLATELGRPCCGAAVDCTDEKATARFVASLDRVDYLVYCAGFTSPVRFADLTAQDWRRVVDINLNGAFVALSKVLPGMARSGAGSIVLVGSAAIVAGGGGRADYVSAKAGLEGLNRAVTREYAPQGIRCNLVHPSLIETDLLAARHQDAAKRAELGRKVPLGRLGRPEDIANLVCFLLSEQASYIVGQSIFVDGGRTFCGG